MAEGYIGNEWLVLRCASSKTLVVTEKLIAAGVVAWTPLWCRKRRLPRNGRFETVLLPCIPSFVFLADTNRYLLDDKALMSKVPPCRLMYSVGRLVRCDDKTLKHLRKISEDDFVTKAPPIPKVGTRHRINAGAFEGLFCSVIGRTTSQAIVELEGQSWHPIKIAPFLLDGTER